MRKSERITCAGPGPGGLKCGCCGGADGGRKGKAKKRAIRSMVRSVRKNDKKRAIREGNNDRDA